MPTLSTLKQPVYPILRDPYAILKMFKGELFLYWTKSKTFSGLFTVWSLSIFTLMRAIRNTQLSEAKKRNRQMASLPKVKRKKRKPDVDAVFFKRFFRILKICVPGVFTKEAGTLLVQFIALILRSMLSIRMAVLIGQGQSAVLTWSMIKFLAAMSQFFILSLTCSGVNSSLRFLTNYLTVMFRRRLTEHIHEKYLKHRNYYHFRNSLGQADQRIVEDLNKFCIVAAELYNRTFKPALDVFFCTSRMARKLGLRSLLFLYSYFGVANHLVNALSPNFSAMIAEKSYLEGDFHSLHSRLESNAEEIAFLRGEKRERTILDAALARLTDFESFFFFQKFFQGIANQFCFKYAASMLGWPTLALPFLLKDEGLTISERSALYRENDQLIRNGCDAVGDLMMVTFKLRTLAGHTSRVSELLEAVEDLSSLESSIPPVYSDSNIIQFNNLTIETPETPARTLLKELNLSVRLKENVLVTGPNGAGKTSLFRVLAGLWRSEEGAVLRPKCLSRDSSELFYVPQKPYLVKGTLRDQITYPKFELSKDKDEDVEHCLRLVGLGKLIKDESDGLDRWEHDWYDVLSGGEKQRVGIARLFYQKPTFAVLDEATSAINVTDEGPLYQKLLDLGITVFSIAHRVELKKFHKKELHYFGDGTGKWKLIDLENERSLSSPGSRTETSYVEVEEQEGE